MRKRAAILTTGIIVAAASATAAPAQAAVSTLARPTVTAPTPAPARVGLDASVPSKAGWMIVDFFIERTKCVDAGQQYQREGWSAWKCDYDLLKGLFVLSIR